MGFLHRRCEFAVAHVTVAGWHAQGFCAMPGVWPDGWPKYGSMAGPKYGPMAGRSMARWLARSMARWLTDAWPEVCPKYARSMARWLARIVFSVRKSPKHKLKLLCGFAGCFVFAVCGGAAVRRSKGPRLVCVLAEACRGRLGGAVKSRRFSYPLPSGHIERRKRASHKTRCLSL